MAMELQVSAEAEPQRVAPLRNVAASYAREIGLPDARIHAVKLCVSECVANVVEHAYPNRDPGPVELLLHQVDDELEVVITDQGRPPHRKHTEEQSLGFGLATISRLASRFTFTASPDGTRVEMRFPLPRRTPIPRQAASSVWPTNRYLFV